MKKSAQDTIESIRKSAGGSAVEDNTGKSRNAPRSSGRPIGRSQAVSQGILIRPWL
jgi:hypothetical protein